MKDAVKFLGACLVLLFLLLAGLTVVGALSLPFRSAAGIAERTLNSDNVIQNYEWFKRQVTDVQAVDRQIAAVEQQIQFQIAAAGPREKWTFEDKQEANRLNAVLIGLKGNRAAMVSEYNARSQMANRTLFKTADLPESLN